MILVCQHKKIAPPLLVVVRRAETRKHLHFIIYRLCEQAPDYSGWGLNVLRRNHKLLKVGDKVMIPRTGGGYSEGTIVSICRERAITEFPVGKTYRGKPNVLVSETEIATKNVALKSLIPIKEESPND